MAGVAKHLVLLLLILAVMNAAPQRKDTHFNMVSGHATAVKQAFRDKDKSNPTTNQNKPNPESVPETIFINIIDESTANGWKPSPGRPKSWR